MDQVEVLIHKHQIKDKNILKILKHLNNVTDLTNLLNSQKNYAHSAIDFNENINGLSSTNRAETERKFFKYNTQECSRKQNFKKSYSLEKDMESGVSFENIEELEHIMKLFRADQLYAPVIKHFSNLILNYRRNFFVNLRFMAKMAPFRKLKNVIEGRRLKNLRDSYSSIVFFLRPHLKLLLLAFVMSKAKQRRIMDSFRTLEGHKKGKKNVDSGLNKVKESKNFIKQMSGNTFSSAKSINSMLTDHSPMITETEHNNLMKILSQYSSGPSLINFESGKPQKAKKDSVVFNFLRQLNNFKDQDQIMNFEYGYHFLEPPKQSKSLNKFGHSEETSVVVHNDQFEISPQKKSIDDRREEPKSSANYEYSQEDNFKAENDFPEKKNFLLESQKSIWH